MKPTNESVKRIILELSTGKKFKIKNPAGSVVTYTTKEVRKLATKKGIQAVKGGIHFFGTKDDILFNLFLLIQELIKKFGDESVVRVFNIIFDKKVNSMKKEALVQAMMQRSTEEGKVH